MKEGILIKRTEDDLMARQADFVVYSIDDVVHACGSLHDFGEGQGEIAAIATNPVYGHLSMGRKILSYLVEKAAKIGMARVFVLTTRTVDWFEQSGFVETTLDSLPPGKRETYNHARKSRIFALELKDRKPIKLTATRAVRTNVCRGRRVCIPRLISAGNGYASNPASILLGHLVKHRACSGINAKTAGPVACSGRPEDDEKLQHSTCILILALVCTVTKPGSLTGHFGTPVCYSQNTFKEGGGPWSESSWIWRRLAMGTGISFADGHAIFWQYTDPANGNAGSVHRWGARSNHASDRGV